MRQFFTWQFWLSLAALGALLVVALYVRDREGSSGPITDAVAGPTLHRVDLVAAVVASHPSADFAVVAGVTAGELALELDGGRRLVVVAGTPFDQGCAVVTPAPPATVPAPVPAPVPAAPPATAPSCIVAADLLGEAVVWAAMAEAPIRATIDLPPVIELRDDGWTLLRNGWEVQRAATVERVCDADTTSLLDFVRRFGPTSTTTFNLAKQEIVRVSCAAP